MSELKAVSFSSSGYDMAAPKPNRGVKSLLDDYTVGKSLYETHMGKVKVAVHKVTGEKVRRFR
jgi:hypothetical protein